MAKRNLTVLFGADTSKLTKALGGLRKKISGAFKGMLSLKGMAIAGIGGFGISQAIGLMMNLSPDFANAMLKLKEPLFNLAAAVADTIAPAFQTLAESMTKYNPGKMFADWMETMNLGLKGIARFFKNLPERLRDAFPILKKVPDLVKQGVGTAQEILSATGSESQVGNAVGLGMQLMDAMLGGSVRKTGIAYPLRLKPQAVDFMMGSE